MKVSEKSFPFLIKLYAIVNYYEIVVFGLITVVKYRVNHNEWDTKKNDCERCN